MNVRVGSGITVCFAALVFSFVAWGAAGSPIADAAMKAKVVALGGMVLPGSAGEFGKFVAAETMKWAKVVKFSGARAN